MLTQTWPAGDKPSPHLIGCKGRRFVSITEAEKKGVINSSNFKTLRDHSSILSCRNLFKDMTAFRVQFMLQMSTNITPSFSSLDGGVERSLAVVDWLLKFCNRPTSGTNERPIDSTLKSQKVVEAHAVQIVYLLMKVDSAWAGFTANINYKESNNNNSYHT